MAEGIADMIECISPFVTGAITWVTSFISCITSNPLILMFVIVAFVGLGVGLLSRLLHL